ncbi:hypothetical protein MNBD_GAMMA07-616 [hydrothermal vent metagenome]|uniref:Inner membrane protein YgaP-like transmembrane domain-containing protein n=1 Tax=hydrothermal vent metagenome TaxID=652676 RepID=A0A3B0X035_9ZZZZ
MKNNIINVGRLDQAIRFFISFVLFYITIINDEIIDDSIIASALITIACLNIIVSTVRICPLYILTGISTYSKKNK